MKENILNNDNEWGNFDPNDSPYVEFDDYDPDKDNYPRSNFLKKEFYQHPKVIDNACEILFHVKRRNTTIKRELYFGLLQFVSCLYVLPVVQNQLFPAGYSREPTVVVTAAASGIGCIIFGLFANLPFIVAPPTSISIFQSVFMQKNSMSLSNGSFSVIISGFILILFGYRPLGKLVTSFIPRSIQIGTAVGIGMITALAGSTEINLVQEGKYTILDLGPITPEVILTIAGVIGVTIAINHHIQGAFSLVLILNTIIWWSSQNDWPSKIASSPTVEVIKASNHSANDQQIVLIFDLVFLYVLLLNGLSKTFAEMAGITKLDENGKEVTPRVRWIFIICGLTTVLSGVITGPPILLSPESAAGIKAGARTGLSTFVCGILFCLSAFFSPFFQAIPHSATSPLLIMIGVLLFQNVKKIDWAILEESVPAFCVLFFIPFTYSILQGVVLGYIVYIIVNICSQKVLKDLYKILFNSKDCLSKSEESENINQNFSVKSNTDVFTSPILNLYKYIIANEYLVDMGTQIKTEDDQTITIQED